MASLGEFLRSERESRNRTLEDIAKATRIRLQYLQAIERDDFDLFSAEAYLKGFLIAYAQQLGIPQKEILERYYEARPSQKPPAATGSPEALIEDDRTETPLADVGYLNTGLPMWLPKVGIAVGGVLGVIVLIFLVRSCVPLAPPVTPEPATNTVADSDHAAVPDSTAPVTVDSVTTPDSGEDVPDKISLRLNTVDTTWMRIRVDDASSEELMLYPGDTREWEATQKFTLNIGNIDGIQLWFNGQPVDSIPSVGGRGINPNFILQKPAP
ncbi:MAG: helix-turn-helix domain-containing protein [Gemmatimonadetes bacterium]|nr:MAG: helix-turn-helix domain-containing protein [Gemmatimonadota bacterium]